MNEIGKTIADSTMKASILTGSATGAGSYFDWIGANAAVLGVLISFSGVVVTGIYYYFMARKHNSSNDTDDRMLNLEDKLNAILKKLDKD